MGEVGARLPIFLPRPPAILDVETERLAPLDAGGWHEVAQGFFPDDLDQSPEFDPTDPEPIPQDDFDQSWGA